MKRFFVPVATLLVALAVGGCGEPNAPDQVTAPAATTNTPAAASATSPAVADGYAPGNGFNATDVAWLQLMSAMTQQNQRLLALVDARAANQRLGELATQATSANGATLVELRQLLARSAAPATNPHAGHDMPGLPNADRLASIAGTRGDEFDHRFTTSFQEYAEQCARLARAEQQAGADPATTKLAATIEQTATTHLAHLQRLTG